MTDKTFASWVEPVAARLRENRAEVLAFARSLPAEAWERSSPDDGWAYRDILAHLAGGNDRIFQQILSAVIAREPIDPAILRIDTNAANTQGVEERRAWPVGKLITALEEEGGEVQELLSRLSESDKEVRQDDMPMSLREFMGIVYEESHDLEHLAQLRTALDA